MVGGWISQEWLLGRTCSTIQRPKAAKAGMQAGPKLVQLRTQAENCATVYYEYSAVNSILALGCVPHSLHSVVMAALC